MEPADLLRIPTTDLSKENIVFLTEEAAACYVYVDMCVYTVFIL
jgi:hypothetical protein